MVGKQPVQVLQGWFASAALHVLVCLLAVQFQWVVKPPSRDPFRWDVVMVEIPKEAPADVSETAVSSTTTPAPEIARTQAAASQPQQAALTQSQIVTRQVDIQAAPVVVQRDQPRVVEPLVAMERPVAVEPRREATVQVLQKKSPAIQDAQQIERTQIELATPEAVTRTAVPVETERPTEAAAQIVQQVASVSTQEAEVGAPKVHGTQPVMSKAVVAKEQVQTDAAVEPVLVPRPVQQEAVRVTPAPLQPEPQTRAVVESVVASAQFHTEPVVEQAIAPSPPRHDTAPNRAPAAPETPVVSAQPVSRTTQPFPGTKSDYGWLIASIAAQLAEVKHYPAAARLNGSEGKVVLRAVIRADGQLADVKVHKSSGHEELDQAAMESLRQACPIHMRHELGRPDITVNVPVVYALAN